MAERHNDKGDFYTQFQEHIIDMCNDEKLAGAHEITSFQYAHDMLIQHVEDVVEKRTTNPENDLKYLDEFTIATAGAFADMVLGADTLSRDDAVELAATISRLVSINLHQMTEQYSSGQMVDIPPRSIVIEEYTTLLASYDDEADVMVDGDTSLVNHAVAAHFYDRYHGDFMTFVHNIESDDEAAQGRGLRKAIGHVAIGALLASGAVAARRMFKR